MQSLKTVDGKEDVNLLELSSTDVPNLKLMETSKGKSQNITLFNNISYGPEGIIDEAEM